MQNNRTKSTLINTSFAVLSRIVSMLFGFIQKTIFIRILGITYAGVSGLFTDILTLLSLAELGIGSAVSYALYKPIAENDYKQIAKLMNFFRKAYIYIAILIMIVGVCLLPFLNMIIKDVPDIQEDIKLIFILYILNTASTYLLVYKNTLLIAAQKQYIVTNIQMCFTIITVIVQCISLLIFKNFIFYLIIQIICSLIQNLIINYCATRRYPKLKMYSKEKISKEDKEKLFNDVKALMMYKIANVVTTGTDSTIISASLGTAQVGILGNYRTIRGYVTSIMAQFYNSINPSLGNLAVTGDKNQQYKLFKKLNFGTFWMTSVCSVCFFILFNPFIQIWLGNEKWLLPTIVVAIYIMEYFFTSMINPVGAFRIANGLFIQTKYLALIQAISNLLISILLVRFFGIMGVLLGTLISRLLTQVWYEPLILYRKVFKKNVIKYYLTLFLYFSITVISCAIVSVITQCYYINNIILNILIMLFFCLFVPNCLIIIIFKNTTEFTECIILINKIFISILNRLKIQYK